MDQKLYSYARHPDITFFFDVPLTVALKRILTGRPELKFYEAGMDMGLSKDPFESFQMFQGRVYEEYQHMRDEFGFVRIDATRSPGLQQREVRELLQKYINLPRYRWKIQSWGLPVTSKRFYGIGLPNVDLSLLKGKLIVIEGADGSGRSTQIAMLRDWLERLGYPTAEIGLKRSTLVGGNWKRRSKGTS